MILHIYMYVCMYNVYTVASKTKGQNFKTVFYELFKFNWTVCKKKLFRNNRTTKVNMNVPWMQFPNL